MISLYKKDISEWPDNYITEKNVFSWIKDKLKKGVEKIRKYNVKSGQFILFNYDSKGYKEGTLEFFDETPFDLCLWNKGKYMLNLNFNYLPVRAKKRVWKKISALFPKQVKEGKLLPRVTYDMLKSELREFDINFIVKLYIKSRATRVTMVTPKQFEKTLSVDLGNFKGISSEKLWAEYKKGKPINQIMKEMRQKQIGK
jgi:hypothetical protein